MMKARCLTMAVLAGIVMASRHRPRHNIAIIGKIIAGNGPLISAVTMGVRHGAIGRAM